MIDLTSGCGRIDAVVCLHAKDLPTIHLCLQGILENLPVNKIYIVTSAANFGFLKSTAGHLIDEDCVIPGLSADLIGGPKWPWYFQQLLKLAMASRVRSPYYVVVDADTVFLRPVKLFDGDRPLYVPATEFHRVYFDTFRSLLGFRARREYSFVAHHMVFKVETVTEMCDRFRPEAPWWKNIVTLASGSASKSLGVFSEYETYGHYLRAVHPDAMGMRPLRWADVPTFPNSTLLRLLRLRFHYCSFHEYMRSGHTLRLRWVARLARTL